MTIKTGIIILGTDARRQVIREAPVRVAIIGELPPKYSERDYIERHIERDRFKNASALYVGIGRWGLWLYWRRRVNLRPGERWLEVRDIQAEHIAQERCAKA